MNLKNEVIIKHNNLIYTILGVILSIRLTFIGQIYLLEIVSIIYFFILSQRLTQLHLLFLLIKYDANAIPAATTHIVTKTIPSITPINFNIILCLLNLYPFRQVIHLIYLLTYLVYQEL